MKLKTSGRPVRCTPAASRPGSTTAAGSRPTGAVEVTSDGARRPPAVDVTRVLTTAEAVVGAVLIARILARRPSGPKAQVTMGPGGWVSMKGGALMVRPARRPWGRPDQLPQLQGPQRAPLWARVLSAVPLQLLTNLERKPRKRT